MADGLSEEELLSAVNSEFETAMGSPGGEISQERADAWKYYLSKEIGNEVEGQSTVRTSDVADVVDGIMPSLLRIFTTAENLVSFDAVGAEDVEKAQQESDYVNHIFFKQNPAFMVMYQWFFDALVQKNGIVKAWWDDSESVGRESYRGLSELELLELLEDEELEPIERDDREAVTIVDGEERRDTVHDVEFRRVSKHGRARVANIPPEEYRISSDSRSIDPADARMVGHERPITRSDLIEMGFDKDIVDNLPAEGRFDESSEEIERRDKSDEDEGGPHDRSQDEILVREAYIRIDFDGDGRSELRQVFTAGNKLLSNEEADRQPFHVISPQPLPHKHFGRASAEKVMDVQEVSTTLLRQVLDNLYHTNNPGHAVWEQGMSENTLDDLLTTRVGSIKRFSRPVNESYSQVTVPFTAGASFPMLEYFDKVKRDRTGVNADGEGLEPERLKNIQTSVLAQQSDLSRMKIEAIARIFAETGIKSLFRHIHELILKHQRKVETVRLRNQWVDVDPREWRTRRDMTVNIGLGIGTREQNLLHLNAIWEKQREVVERGGMNLLVKPKDLFNTASEIVKNANLKQPEMFFSDPGDQLAPPPSDEQMQLQQQQQALEARRQELDQNKRQLDETKQQIEAQKAQMQHERELMKIQLQKEQQEDKFAVEMEKIQNQLTQLDLQFRQINVPGSRVATQDAPGGNE